MRILIISMLIALFAAPALAGGGVTTIKSNYGPQKTADRLQQAVMKKGLTLFTVIDHAENAKEAGLTMPFTKVFIFGNPKIGTPLMECGRTMALDLPQKMLIHEKDGIVYVSYNDQNYLAKRHELGECAADKLNKAAKALESLARQATGQQ